MKIEGIPEVTIINNILSGYYVVGVNNGIRPKLYQFSSPSYGISNFQTPYDAVLPAPTDSTQGITAVGQRIRSSTDTISSDRTGKLYFYDNTQLYGTCHGFGRNDFTFYYGASYYQAFYPAGYFAPPYGENVSLFLANSDTSKNLANGACAPINITEYNEQFGITSQADSDVFLETDSLTPNSYSPIFSPRGVCPSDVAIETFYDEVDWRQIQGTSSSIGGGTFYNGNPIPTSLDGYRIQIPNGRYQVQGTDPNRSVVFSDNRPVPSYTSDNQVTDLNNVLCPASIMETDLSVGKGTNGLQLVEAPDLLTLNSVSASQDQVFVDGGLDTHFNYWHFLYKENADDLPFSNGALEIDTSQTVSHKSISQDTLLFEPSLASDDSYWQNRQCPDTVDFLPWTFGASIYACPSSYFDIPYYSAIKKFGFYGTRFLNTCNKILLTSKWNGVDMSSELPSGTGFALQQGEIEPANLDAPGTWTFGAFDNLLRTAKAEERYSNMYALNKGFFLWANNKFLTVDPNFISLKQFTGFDSAYTNLYNQFQAIFTNGLASFISGEPAIIMQAGLAGSTYVADNGTYSDLLFTNDAYKTFFTTLTNIIPSTGMFLWNTLEASYAFYVSDGNGGVNEPFYGNIISGREKRILTRYMENTIRGNPVDLYPLNHIYFSFDSGKALYEHTGWARGLAPLAKNSLPSVDRRYFEGAYGNASAITGLTQILSQLSFADNTAFYPGFFNDYKFGQDLPSPHYVPVISGIIRDTEGRKFSPSGWLALGYNEIGSLDGNFSCFTPIFIQQPINKVFTKIGQAPTFRAQAVDYHSIPDDKLSSRYPEIFYWAYKLKLMDNSFKNLYPMHYKWLRVPKTIYPNWLASGVITGEFSNPTGNWCCAEGDGPNCTAIHPLESFPTGAGNSADAYTFVQGAKLGVDDQYYYMCLASGRFGVRISETSELNIEDWVRFDVSVKNGMNAVPSFSIGFVVNDINGNDNQITFSPQNMTAYMGYQQDSDAIPEAIIEQKVPPPNAGYGDVTAFRFVGPIQYIGATRSYQPDTLMDTRGVRGAWGRFLEYGQLVTYSKTLTQNEGNLLYGYKHLPTCSNYQMSAGKKGIQVIANYAGGFISHWTLAQQAVAALDTNNGMKYDKLTNVGQLYPPITRLVLSTDINGNVVWSKPGQDPLVGGYGVGHWQWGNNLGSIKRFGKFSTPKTDDLVVIGVGAPPANQISQDLINKVVNVVIQPTTLAGTNCGYTPFGLGRNMVYYIEAFGRFYLICDQLKKKNVKNLSFMCPGLRSTNSAIQYCWLGHPSNTYVERRAMYGPYAYQWRVRRHNRDRNGNGISEGFYSMGWNTRFSLMYDAPAIFGLYSKKSSTPSYSAAIQQTITARNQAFPNGIGDISTFRNNWFGVAGGEGTAIIYGNFFCPANSTSDLCNYIGVAQSLAEGLDMKAYSCSQAQLGQGQCFDPCISMRYGQGFFPGGKSQNLFGYLTDVQNNVPKNIRLVPNANLDVKGNIITIDEQSLIDKNSFFRSPINTPHARITRGLMKIGLIAKEAQEVVGISPCRDGGADHCNFITPTVHLNSSSIVLTSASAFNVAGNYASNIYESYNIRGDED